jgi:Lrp/AsnC family transcriptional regulator, regulator for asnA, asnC and gidA
LNLSIDIVDKLDRIILQALQEDGRTPFTDIAREAGVSETTIRSHYRSLVEAGVVRTVGYVNPRALGYDTPAIIGISSEPGAIDRLAHALSNLPEVRSVYKTLGTFDLVVEVYCQDLAHINHLLTHQISLLPGVQSTETLMIAQSYKQGERWLPGLDPDR